MPRHIPAGLLAPLLFAGCGFWDNLNRDAGGGAAGFGAPALEVTATDGTGTRVQLGPMAPDTGSAAQFVDTRDGQGRIVQSVFSLSASSASLGIGCSLSVVRENPEGTTPIGVAALQIAADNTGRTPDGTASPSGIESATVPGAQLNCSGSGCDGSFLSLTALDAAHAEGSISGTFQDAAGRGPAGVVCSFYVPMGVFQP